VEAVLHVQNRTYIDSHAKIVKNGLRWEVKLTHPKSLVARLKFSPTGTGSASAYWEVKSHENV